MRSNKAPDNVTLDLRVSGRWRVLGWLFAIWIGLGLVAICFFLAGVHHGSGRIDDLVVGIGLIATGVPADTSAWRMATSHSSIKLDGTIISIDHPGVFRRPLVLNRRQVHGLLIEPGTTPNDLPISTRHAPDLSVGARAGSILTIVLAEPLPLLSIARRGLSLEPSRDARRFPVLRSD